MISRLPPRHTATAVPSALSAPSALSGFDLLCFLGVSASLRRFQLSWVCGLPLCGAGWLATRLFVAWVLCSAGPVAAPERPSATRPQDAILPHEKPSGFASKYAQIPAVLRLNRAGLHFHVAPPHQSTKPDPTCHV
jgi:hypothetical protein